MTNIYNVLRSMCVNVMVTESATRSKSSGCWVSSSARTTLQGFVARHAACQLTAATAVLCARTVTHQRRLIRRNSSLLSPLCLGPEKVTRAW